MRRPFLFVLRLAQQLQQLGDVRGNPSRLIARQWLSRCTRIIEIDIGKVLAFAVAHHEPRLLFLDRPGRREATGGSI